MANNAQKNKKFVFFHIQEDPFARRSILFSDEYGRSPDLRTINLPSTLKCRAVVLEEMIAIHYTWIKLTVAGTVSESHRIPF